MAPPSEQGCIESLDLLWNYLDDELTTLARVSEHGVSTPTRPAAYFPFEEFQTKKPISDLAQTWFLGFFHPYGLPKRHRSELRPKLRIL